DTASQVVLFTKRIIVDANAQCFFRHGECSFVKCLMNKQICLVKRPNSYLVTPTRSGHAIGLDHGRGS
ncbi:MAG: hypothetical protein LC776_19315, partial [Acidobacteria bacterium]|nr:hypothetical protein [Acidobacteriota bacterium]